VKWYKGWLGVLEGGVGWVREGLLGHRHPYHLPRHAPTPHWWKVVLARLA